MPREERNQCHSTIRIHGSACGQRGIVFCQKNAPGSPEAKGKPVVPLNGRVCVPCVWECGQRDNPVAADYRIGEAKQNLIRPVTIVCRGKILCVYAMTKREARGEGSHPLALPLYLKFIVPRMHSPCAAGPTHNQRRHYDAVTGPAPSVAQHISSPPSVLPHYRSPPSSRSKQVDDFE